MASGVSTTLPTRPVAGRVRTVLAGWVWASVAIGSKQQISAMATRQRKPIAEASIGDQAGEDPGRAILCQGAPPRTTGNVPCQPGATFIPRQTGIRCGAKPEATNLHMEPPLSADSRH